MAEEVLYPECPLCTQGAVTRQGSEYRCQHCGLTLQERRLLGLFKKDHFAVTRLGDGEFNLAAPGFKGISLRADALKVVLGNVYSDAQLAALAGGDLKLLRPVRTVLAQIILEQLNETCYLQVNGLRRAHGPVLSGGSSYRPEQPVPRQELNWQDRGNLFCTDQRLVFPSDNFTFMRLDRKLAAVQAFTNGVAVQRRGEDFATYFVGCYPHEAALVAAYVLGKLPALREPAPAEMPANA